MHDSGAVVNISIATPTGVVHKRDNPLLKENGGALEQMLTKNWAKSLFYRMDLVNRRANPKFQLSILSKSQFLFDMKATVEMQGIPPELIINWDQTSIKIMPVSCWTMEQKGAKQVEISGVDGKMLFLLPPLLEFLPFHLIYQGKRPACLPTFNFPSDWNVTYTPNQWSNEQTMKTYIKEIIVPYVKQKGHS